MASVNKIILVGRLTRDPECRTFQSGGKVAEFGIAVDGDRKKGADGKWEAEPCFLDCKAFNRGEFSKTADLIEQYLHKGSLVYVEGKMVTEKWIDKSSNQERSKLRVIVDTVQFLDTKGSREKRSDASPNLYTPPQAGGSEDIPF